MTVIRYLKIEGLSAQGVQIMSSMHTVGLPSLSGLIGFSWSLIKDGEASWANGTRYAGAAFCLRQISPERPRRLQFGTSKKPSEVSGIINPSSVPRFSSSLVVDVIIRLEVTETSPLYEWGENGPAITDAVFAKRLGGGEITEVAAVALHSDLLTSLGGLGSRRGYFIEDFSEELARLSEDDLASGDARDGLDSIIKRLSDWAERSRDFNRGDDYDADYDGCVVPAALGYRLLAQPLSGEQPSRLAGAKVALAETVIGLVRLATGKSVSSRGKQSEREGSGGPKIFWGYETINDLRLFKAKQ